MRGVATSDIGVISQFSGDLAEATKLGISAEKADMFFNDTAFEIKKTN